MNNEQLMAEVVDRLRNRYFGKYRGAVTEVDAATMRIRANVPAVLGEQVSGWCLACVPYAGPDVGFVMLPEIGSGVWIEFEAGDVSYPIWTGCYWREGEIPADAAEGVKSIITKAGKLAFDGDGGSITLSDSQEHSVVLDSSGVTITADPNKVAIGTSSVSVNDGALEVT